MEYIFGSRNGIDPQSFCDRIPATNILNCLPATKDEFSRDDAIKRVLLFGPPTSGKTSIMGKIGRVLEAKYPGIPIFHVRPGEHVGKCQDAIKAINHFRTGVVLLDDAQKWYKNAEFFGLFKNTKFLLVAAATYSAEAMNEDTPVEFQLREKSNLHDTEVSSLLEGLAVPHASRSEVKRWFGDVYGRYHIVARGVLDRWVRLSASSKTLAEVYFSSDTMHEPGRERFLPALSDEMRNLVLRVWKGCATLDERKKLVPYGILEESGNDWSCDYVSRKYFLDIFHAEAPTMSELFQQGLPSEKDLARAGLGAVNWAQLQMSRSSSEDGEFPIEDVWQAEFYGAIGKFVPRSFTFCKEYVTKAGEEAGHVDFVLRDGISRAIEFLIRSRDVSGHHKRFEEGAYRSLCLEGGTYLVVDIIPWGGLTDLHGIGPSEPLQLAEKKFINLGSQRRRMHHAVFIASNDLTSGILYTYDGETNKVVAYGRSPAPQLQMGGF